MQNIANLTDICEIAELNHLAMDREPFPKLIAWDGRLSAEDRTYIPSYPIHYMQHVEFYTGSTSSFIPYAEINYSYAIIIITHYEASHLFNEPLNN